MINELIDRIIINQKDNTKKYPDFCCGVYCHDNPVNIIETDKIKIVFTDDGSCEIRRKYNNNPVIEVDGSGRVYRCNGEWVYLKYEMYKLAGLEDEAKELLDSGFNYD